MLISKLPDVRRPVFLSSKKSMANSISIRMEQELCHSKEEVQLAFLSGKEANGVKVICVFNYPQWVINYTHPSDESLNGFGATYVIFFHLFV